MALLTINDASAGLQSAPLVAAAGGGDTIEPGARNAGWTTGVFLVVRNADTTTTDVTVNGVVYTVPANTGLAIIPVSAFYPKNAKAITYSKVTSLTVGAFQLAGK